MRPSTSCEVAIRIVFACLAAWVPDFVSGVVDRRLSVEGMIKFHWWDFGKLQVDKGPHILGLERDFDAARQIIPFADFGGDYCAVSLWPRHRHYVGGHLLAPVRYGEVAGAAGAHMSAAAARLSRPAASEELALAPKQPLQRRRRGC